MKRGHSPKRALTPEERLRAAYAHDVMGVDQHIISALFGVNQGRAAEAITAVREAVGFVKPTPKGKRGRRAGGGGTLTIITGGSGGSGSGARC